MIKEIHLRNNLYAQIGYDKSPQSPSEFTDITFFVRDSPANCVLKFKGLSALDITNAILNPSDKTAWILEENEVFPVSVNDSKIPRYVVSSQLTSEVGYVLVPKDSYFVLNEIKTKELAVECLRMWENYYDSNVFQLTIVERTVCNHCHQTTDTVVDTCHGIYENLDNITKEFVCQMI